MCRLICIIRPVEQIDLPGHPPFVELVYTNQQRPGDCVHSTGININIIVWLFVATQSTSQFVGSEGDAVC